MVSGSNGSGPRETFVQVSSTTVRRARRRGDDAERLEFFDETNEARPKTLIQNVLVRTSNQVKLTHIESNIVLLGHALQVLSDIGSTAMPCEHVHHFKEWL